MALTFQTIGFINFNKEYNKILKSGSITVSFTASVKNQVGEYETQYFNGLIPAKLAQNAKEFINTKQLAKISGIASPAKKGYISFTILEIEQYQKEQKSDDTEIDIDDFPFLEITLGRVISLPFILEVKKHGKKENFTKNIETKSGVTF